MTFEIIYSLKSCSIQWVRLFVAASCLSLLVACGGGGSGTSTSSGAAPVVSLTRSGSSDAIYSGNSALLLPSIDNSSTVLSAVLSWQDAQGTTQSQTVVSNTPISVNPTQTTTYTLTVSYQDPSTVRPQTLTTIATQVVTIKPKDNLAPTYNLVVSNNLITSGNSVTLTPTFAWSGGSILSSVIKFDSQSIPVSSSNSMTHAPSSNTTYTLRIEYRDERVIPNVIETVEKSVLVEVITGPGFFTIGGNMSVGRSDYAMVQLPSSPLILVAGGTSTGTDVLKSAELYDPVTNSWRATSDMKSARRGHTATVLNNGKILVVGGYDGKNSLATAETYDPSTGAWTNTISPMAFTHRYHTATLLSDGKVLIAGGTVGPLGTADSKYTEVYSPSTGGFTAGPLLPEERLGHTATLLSNGDVLFVGNSLGDGSVVRSLTYDGSNFTWSHLAEPAVTIGTLQQARYNHSAVLLLNGKVLVTGGFGLDSKTAELFNPVSHSWSSARTMTTPRSYHTSTTLRNGDVIVIGGYNGSSSISSIDYYETITNTWSFASQKSLMEARSMNTSLMLSNGKVLTLGSYCPTPSGSCTTLTTTEIWAP